MQALNDLSRHHPEHGTTDGQAPILQELDIREVEAFKDCCNVSLYVCHDKML